MTRANVEIRGHYGTSNFVITSDGYPGDIIPEIERILKNDENERGKLFCFINDLDLQIGIIGNPYYYYYIDIAGKEVICWEAQIYWINAPKDWKKKGWNCWQHHTRPDIYGYTNWRKGKLIYEKVI